MIRDRVTLTAAQTECLPTTVEEKCELSVEPFGGHGWVRVQRLDKDGWPSRPCYIPPEGGPALDAEEAADAYRQRCGVELDAAV